MVVGMKDNQITIKELLARQALRDHFAGLAMQALLRDNNMVELRDSHVIEIWRGIPKNAYLIADAMLKERAK